MEVLPGTYEVQKVLDWLPRAPSSFDPKFVHNLKARLDRGLGLTDRQLLSIQTIIAKFIDTPRKAPTQRLGLPYYKINDALSHYY